MEAHSVLFAGSAQDEVFEDDITLSFTIPVFSLLSAHYILKHLIDYQFSRLCYFYLMRCGDYVDLVG